MNLADWLVRYAVVILLLWWGVFMLAVFMTNPVTPTAFPKPSPSASPLLAETPSSLLSLSPSPAPSPSPSPSPAPLPAQVQLTGGTHVFQTFNNCGPASLSMALSYFGTSVSQQTLGEQLRPYQNVAGDNDDKSVTLNELARKGQEFGLIPYHRPAGDVELLQQFLAAGIPVITRTWLNPGEDIGHYRVVVGYNQQERVLIQDDSLQGNDLRYSYDAFNEIWQAFNFEFLVLVPPEKQSEAERILGPLVDSEMAWNLAWEHARDELAQDPTDRYAQFNQVVALYHLEKYSEARQVYEAVQDRLPRRMLWYQIEPILVYYQLGAYDTVLTMTEAIFDSQNRAFSELHWLRAEVFAALDQPAAAAQARSLAQQYNQSSYWKENLP